MKLSKLVPVAVLLISSTVMAGASGYETMVTTNCSSADSSKSVSIEILSMQPSSNQCKYTVANLNGVKVAAVSSDRIQTPYLLNLANNSLITAKTVTSALLDFNIDKIKDKIASSKPVTCLSLYEELKDVKLLQCEVNGVKEYFAVPQNSQTAIPVTCQEEVQKVEDMNPLKQAWVTSKLEVYRQRAVETGHAYAENCQQAQ
ncbi:MAG: hypothetical protein ACXVCY_01660 [Pseudobdellovibrionaceae bacterium]